MPKSPAAVKARIELGEFMSLGSDDVLDGSQGVEECLV